MKKLDIYRPSPTTENFYPGRSDFSFLGEGEKKHKDCLPVKIAGELGWDMRLPEDFTLRWDGGYSSKAITISKAKNPENWDTISSSMGYGIISFKIPYLFDIEPGNFLWIKAPTNNPLSLDLYPTEGVVESDWFPGHITMNYRVTTPNVDIHLSEGKSYCRVVPYPKNYIETFSPQWQSMEDNPEFARRYENYTVWNRFMIGAKQFMRSYMLGFIGDTPVENTKKILLSKPAEGKRCPFHNIIGK
jgi:hypothetical protein